jgi:hypothetical protein
MELSEELASPSIVGRPKRKPDDRDLDPRQNCDSDDEEDVLQVLTVQNLSCGINHLENQ